MNPNIPYNFPGGMTGGAANQPVLVEAYNYESGLWEWVVAVGDTILKTGKEAVEWFTDNTKRRVGEQIADAGTEMQGNQTASTYAGRGNSSFFDSVPLPLLLVLLVLLLRR